VAAGEDKILIVLVKQLIFSNGGGNEYGILAVTNPWLRWDGNLGEQIPDPKLFPIKQRRSQRVYVRSAILPPALAVGKFHEGVTADGFSGFLQRCELKCESSRLISVVVIVMSDILPACHLAPEVSFSANRHAGTGVEDSDAWIVWDQSIYVFDDIGHDDELAIEVRLKLIAGDGFR
jgi:hypothetical protein